MISQSIFADNRPNPNISPTVWWDEIRFHTDRFFNLAHSFDRQANVRIQAALMANLIDQQEMVEGMPYPPSATEARSRLLDAMAHTLIGINSSLHKDTETPYMSVNPFATARVQLNRFEDALTHILAS